MSAREDQRRVMREGHSGDDPVLVFLQKLVLEYCETKGLVKIVALRV